MKHTARLFYLILALASDWTDGLIPKFKTRTNTIHTRMASDTILAASSVIVAVAMLGIGTGYQLSQISHGMAVIQHNITDIRRGMDLMYFNITSNQEISAKNFHSITEKLNEQNAVIQHNFTDIRRGMDLMHFNISSNQQISARNFRSMTDKLNQQSAILDTTGYIYEALVKTSIKDVKGSSYVKGCRITNLEELALFCSGFRNESVAASYYGYNPANVADVLSKYAQIQLVEIDKWSKVGKNSSLPYYLNRYKNTADPLKLEHLKSSPLGFFAFSRYAYDNKKKVGFLTELEIDMRGEIEFKSDTLYVTLAEIKSGKGYNKAIEQVLIRLAFIVAVFKVVLLDIHVDNANFKAEGIIWTRQSDWKSPDEELVTKLIKKLSLDLNPKNVNITVERID